MAARPAFAEVAYGGLASAARRRHADDGQAAGHFPGDVDWGPGGTRMKPHADHCERKKDQGRLAEGAHLHGAHGGGKSGSLPPGRGIR